MTALLEPSFNDIIFDPACGTGGFLFDAFEFVMQRYLNDKEWPGEKGHTELQEWFSEYFENNSVQMPSDSQTKQFYRSGVAGIEYLGMIREMAAINFYIRGLNPANILVDCLSLYHQYIKHGNKPPENKHQFCIPAIWIKTLDPRVKEKIRTETRSDMEVKGVK